MPEFRTPESKAKEHLRAVNNVVVILSQIKARLRAADEVEKSRLADLARLQREFVARTERRSRIHGPGRTYSTRIRYDAWFSVPLTRGNEQQGSAQPQRRELRERQHAMDRARNPHRQLREWRRKEAREGLALLENFGHLASEVWRKAQLAGIPEEDWLVIESRFRQIRDFVVEEKARLEELLR